MKTRILAVLMVLILALGLVSVVGAQDAAGCYNLSAEDCALIQSASANSDNISSFNMSWSLDFSATGLGVLNTLAGGGVPESMSFSSTGEGPFVIDSNMDFPIAVYNDITANLDVGGEATDFGSFPFAIVNGFVYVPTGEVVAGIPLSVLLDPEALGLSDTLSSMGLPMDTLNLDFSNLEINNLGDLMGDAESSVDASTEALLAPYITYTRLDNEEMMGQAMYPFEFTLDLGGLLNSDEFSSLLTLAGSAAPDDANTQMALQMIPMLLGGLESEVNVTQWAGADDNFIHRLAVDMTFNIDLSALMGSQPGSMDPVMMEAHFALDLSQINEMLDVPVPANAVEFTEEQAKQMLGSGM